MAAELSAIQQERGESVEQFAFKYKKLLHQLEKLGEKIAKDCPTFVISQFISKVNSRIAQQLVKAAEFETLDKTVEAARRVELSFQTPPTASNANRSLDEWKVTSPNAFVSSTAVKSQDQQFQRQQRACYNCGETNHLSRYCPKNHKEASKQPEVCKNFNRFPSLIVRKMATNAHMADNTNANAVINGVVKLSDILKIAQQAHLAVLFHPMR